MRPTCSIPSQTTCGQFCFFFPSIFAFTSATRFFLLLSNQIEWVAYAVISYTIWCCSLVLRTSVSDHTVSIVSMEMNHFSIFVRREQNHVGALNGIYFISSMHTVWWPLPWLSQYIYTHKLIKCTQESLIKMHVAHWRKQRKKQRPPHKQTQRTHERRRKRTTKRPKIVSSRSLSLLFSHLVILQQFKCCLCVRVHYFLSLIVRCLHVRCVN